MAIAAIRRPWTSSIKPPLDARINLEHPRLKGCVGYWRFAEKSGSVFDVINGLEGTLQASNTWVENIHGPVVDFNGAQGVITVADPLNVLDIGINLTVFCRFLARSYSTGTNENRLVLRGTGSHGANLYTLDCKDTGGTIRAYGNFDRDAVAVFGATTLPTDEMIETCLTVDLSDLKIYFNGLLDGTTVHAQTPSADTSPNFFGGRSAGSDRLDGIIDEVRIYNRILTADEILSLTVHPYLEANTVLYYNIITAAPVAFNNRMLLMGVGV
jgi:hypothetical protein